MERNEPSANVPDPDAVDDELRIENLARPGSKRHKLARHLWALCTTSRKRPQHARLSGTAVTILLALPLALLMGDGRSAAGVTTVAGATPTLMGPGDAVISSPAPSAPPEALGGGWEQVTLPDAPGRIVRSMAPSRSDPSLIYACSAAAVDPAHSDTADGPLVVWRTRDAGAHWTTLPLPSLVGRWCMLRLAPDGAPAISLLAYHGPRATPYVSRDAGATWMQIATPDVIPTGVTGAQFELWPTADHLYYWFAYDAYDTWVTVTSGNGSAASRVPHYVSGLWRSDNDGRTWQRADGSLANEINYVYPTREQNRLVTRQLRWTDHDAHADLWETRDAGQTWRLATTIDTIAGHLVVPTRDERGVISGTADYATVAEQIPSALFRLKALAGAQSGSWSMLPPLPVAGASPSRVGLLQIYEETDDGRLLAFGVDPQVGVPSEDAMRASGWNGFAQQWLWVWDQRAGRWLAWPTPLSVPYRWGCGVCLEHFATWASGPGAGGDAVAGTYLWVRDVSGDLTGHGLGTGNVAYRLFVPDAAVGELLPP